TGTAVVGIGTQVGARAVNAVFSALDALIDAQSGDAGDRFVRTRRGTRGATVSAVENVRGEIGTIAAATGLTIDAAVVPAGPAVRVGLQIAADSLAGRDRAAGVAAARSGETAGVAVAFPAGVQTLALLFAIAALAEGFARIDIACPRRFQS